MSKKEKYEPGKYIKQARETDKVWLALNLFGWLTMFVGGILIATFLYQGFLQDFLATRPYTIYFVPVFLIIGGFMLQRMAGKRSEKMEGKGKGGGGTGYK